MFFRISLFTVRNLSLRPDNPRSTRRVSRSIPIVNPSILSAIASPPYPPNALMIDFVSVGLLRSSKISNINV